MLKRMPSPNGSNHAALYVRSRSPVAAYDSANGGLMDDGTLEKILQFLKGKLDPDSFASVEEILLSNSVAAMDVVSQKREAGFGMDARARHVDAVIAATERNAKSFARMFPAASRIGIA